MFLCGGISRLKLLLMSFTFFLIGKMQNSQAGFAQLSEAGMRLTLMSSYVQVKQKPTLNKALY